MAKQMLCYKCGRVISEAEWQARYDELLQQGIMPMMLLLCKECRSGSQPRPHAVSKGRA